MADHSHGADGTHGGGQHGTIAVDETPVSNTSVVGWGLVMAVVFFGSAAVLSSIFNRITEEELNAKVGAVSAPELLQLRAEEKQLLSTYGYTDKAKQLVHIPIEEGMKQVIAEAQKEAQAPAPAGDQPGAAGGPGAAPLSGQNAPPPAGAPVGVPAAGANVPPSNVQGAQAK